LNDENVNGNSDFAVPAALRGGKFMEHAYPGSRAYRMITSPDGEEVSTRRYPAYWCPSVDQTVRERGAEFTQDGIVSIDCDKTLAVDGTVWKDGFRWLIDRMVEMGLTPDTTGWGVVRTPGHAASGDRLAKGPGKHLYFAADPDFPVKTGALKQCREIEVKTIITCPGSPGYTVEHFPDELPVIPPWLCELIGRATPGDTTTGFLGWSELGEGQRSFAENRREQSMPGEDDFGGIPEIEVSSNLSDMTDAMRKLLTEQNNPPEIFRTQGKLTRVGQDDYDWPVIRPYRSAGLQSWMASKARWRSVRTVRGEQRVSDTHPPALAIDVLLETADAIGEVPVIEQVTAMPFFAADGTLVTAPGYSTAGRAWYEPTPGVVVPAVPANPSQGDLAEAVRLLTKELLVDFPFVGASDRASALALILLPFARQLISGPTPINLIDAPTPGSGKTLLATVATLIAYGKETGARALPGDDDELRKALSAIFLAGYPVVWFDNVHSPVRSAALAAATTTREWEDRLLGKNENITARVRCVWIVTGNNVRFSGELARRGAAARIRLDPAVKAADAMTAEHPSRRTGFRHPDLTGWVTENRGLLAWACLTIIQSWIRGGRTPWSGSPIGTFEEWSRVMGGIIEHAGGTGFLSSFEASYDELDDEQDSVHEFIEKWWDDHGAAPVSTAQLIETARKCDGDVLGISDKLTARAVSTAAGIRLKTMTDRVFNGYRVRNMAKRGAQWMLIPHGTANSSEN
jgi:hypothetical protein